MSDKTCFLVCAIGANESETRKHADQLLNHIIKPVAESKGYNVIRADKILETDVITDSIIENLLNADLVIADLSVPNPNVYYELGYRAALKKPLIQIISEGVELPFDLKVTRTFSYSMTDPDKIEGFKHTLSSLIDNLEDKQTEIQTTSTQIGQEMGMMFATTVISDMLQNPESSMKYVGMFKALAEMKKAIDDSSK